MHGLKILLAIAAFALGSAASATLPTSAAGDPQQAEYAPDTTTDPFSAANDYTGTYIHIFWGYLMPKQNRTWYSNWNKNKQKQNTSKKRKRKTKIQFKNRLNETSLLPKSFVCQSGDWKWDWKCLPGVEWSAASPPLEADKYVNILWCIRRLQPIAQLLSKKLRKYSRINICLICRYYTKQDWTTRIWIRRELSPYRR